MYTKHYTLDNSIKKLECICLKKLAEDTHQGICNYGYPWVVEL